MKIEVGGRSYDVHPKVLKALEGDGIKYFTGDIKGDVAVTLVATLKRSDPDFDIVFAEMYDTSEGELLLRDGEDYSGLNDFDEEEPVEA